MYSYIYYFKKISKATEYKKVKDKKNGKNIAGYINQQIS